MAIGEAAERHAIREMILGLRSRGHSDAMIADHFDSAGVTTIVRPGEPWTADDVRAVLAKGGEG